MAVHCCKSSFQKGYDEAFAEIYRTAGSPDHAARCGECRPCGVVRTVIEDAVHQLAAFMTEEEFWLFSGVVEKVRERRRLERAAKRRKRRP